MATKAEKEQLIETLKFTPRNYSLYIGGYGGESFAGRVSKETYEYFKQHKIDIEEYATDWDDKFSDVPGELQPFSPGSPYDCDELFHMSGAELTNLNEIRVSNEHGEEHWSCSAGLNELEDAGVVVNENGAFHLDDDLKPGDIAFWGGQGEKGTFFDGEFELTAPFDPAKLTIGYESCDGWWLIASVEYDGVEIDGTGAYSTTGKWNEHKWILTEGVESYDPVSREDLDDEDSDNDEPSDEELDWSALPDMPELPLTDWYDISIKPVHKGEYDVDLGPSVVWPFTRIIRAEWTGRTWKNEEGKKLTEHVAWRGLAIDPNAKVEFDWSPLLDEEETK